MSPGAPRPGAVVRSVGYTISEADIDLFAAVSTDFSRLHSDAAYAARGLFGQRVGHGLLGMSLAEGLLARQRPRDAIAFAWQWDFTAPFFIGDTLRGEAAVEAIEEVAELSLVGIRGGRVECLWPIAARGALT